MNMAEPMLEEEVRVKTAAQPDEAEAVQKKPRIERRLRRLTTKDLRKSRLAEQILNVISKLISNTDVLDFTVLADRNVVVTGAFEGVRIKGKFKPVKLVGMATANFKHTWTGWKLVVDDVIVLGEYRGQGIGRELMQEMETLARNHRPPCTVISLVSDRDEAFAFYYSLGYVTRRDHGVLQFKKKL